MADPISIFGAAASVLSVINVLSKSIALLDNLKAQWKTADLALLSLASQLATLNAALVKIQEWTESGVDKLHHQLVMDLSKSIDCCYIHASKVHDEIADLQTASAGGLQASDKVRFKFKRSGISELQSMIDRQTSTLTLLLTACNSESLAKQQEILVDSSVRNRINAAQRDTASLTSLIDSSSFFSRSTENSSKLSMLFDFDDELFASKPYKALLRKAFKFSIRSQKRRSLEEPSQDFTDMSSIAATEVPKFCTNILLLGPGESSKTTFLKQMQFLYSYHDLIDDWLTWKSIIYSDLKNAFRTLYWCYDGYSSWSGKSLPLTEEVLPWAKSMLRTMYSMPGVFLPPRFAEILEMLLDGIRNNASFPRDIYELPGNLDYFAKHLPRVCAQGYRPSDKDIIRTRVCTTGIHRYVFQVNQKEYGVYDTGGEKSERKKWIHVYKEEPVVLFFVPISCYDQLLYKDYNRMQEALEIFEAVANGEWSAHSKMLLCFTKMDIFEERMLHEENQFTDHFPEYKGSPTDVAAAKDHITSRFTGLLETPRQLSIYYIDATSTNDVRKVLANIFDDIPTSPPHFTFTKQDGLEPITE